MAESMNTPKKQKITEKEGFRDRSGDVQIPDNYKVLNQPTLALLVRDIKPDLNWLRNALGKSEMTLARQIGELKDKLSQKESLLDTQRVEIKVA